MYDLVSDPDEQKNLIASPAHKTLIVQLKSELKSLRKYYEDNDPAGELDQ
jgi:hypothetical protein